MTNGPDVETINKVMWTIPNALCLIGSRSGDEWNGMTQSWVSQVSMEPVLVAISVDAQAVTNRLIRNGGSFTVNLWDREDTRVFVKFSKPAVKDGDTLNGRPIRTGVTGAPIFTVSSGRSSSEATIYSSARSSTPASTKTGRGPRWPQ